MLHTRARERLLEHFLSVVLRPGRMPPLTSQSPPFSRSSAAVGKSCLWHHAVASPGVGYLFRLRARMEKAGLPPEDKPFRLTDSAYHALHSLCVELHYLSCASGVGRPARNEGSGR